MQARRPNRAAAFLYLLMKQDFGKGIPKQEMKTLYPWLPDEEKLVSDIGISMEDARKISDEKVSRLNLDGMEMTASEYAVEIGGHNGAPRPED